MIYISINYVYINLTATMGKKVAKLKSNFVIPFLKAELKNTKLIRGLQSAGLNPDDYYLGVSTEILKLIGFNNAENDDELHDFYFTKLEKCNQKHSKFMKNLSSLANELLNELLAEKHRRETSETLDKG